jgi:hypothetical protein
MDARLHSELAAAQRALAGMKEDRREELRQVARSPRKRPPGAAAAAAASTAAAAAPPPRRAPNGAIGAYRPSSAGAAAPPPQQQQPQVASPGAEALGRQIDAAIDAAVADLFRTPPGAAKVATSAGAAPRESRFAAPRTSSLSPSGATATFLTRRRANVHCELDEPGEGVLFPLRRRNGPLAQLARLFACGVTRRPPSPSTRTPDKPYERPSSGQAPPPPTLQIAAGTTPLCESVAACAPDALAAALAAPTEDAAARVRAAQGARTPPRSAPPPAAAADKAAADELVRRLVASLPVPHPPQARRLERPTAPRHTQVSMATLAAVAAGGGAGAPPRGRATAAPGLPRPRPRHASASPARTGFGASALRGLEGESRARSAPAAPTKASAESAGLPAAPSPLRRPAVEPRPTRASAARGDATRRLLASQRARASAAATVPVARLAPARPVPPPPPAAALAQAGAADDAELERRRFADVLARLERGAPVGDEEVRAALGGGPAASTDTLEAHFQGAGDGLGATAGALEAAMAPARDGDALEAPPAAPAPGRAARDGALFSGPRIGAAEAEAPGVRLVSMAEAARASAVRDAAAAGPMLDALLGMERSVTAADLAALRAAVRAEGAALP